MGANRTIAVSAVDPGDTCGGAKLAVRKAMAAHSVVRTTRIKRARTRQGRKKGTARVRSILLNLGFLDLDVLARPRIIFADTHLLGVVPRIFLGHVEEAGIG